MIRSRFKELCDFLETKQASLGIRDDQVDTAIENFIVDYGGNSITVNGLHFANFR